MTKFHNIISLFFLVLPLLQCEAFSTAVPSIRSCSTCSTCSSSKLHVSNFLENIFGGGGANLPSFVALSTQTAAKDLLQSLVEEQNCFTTEEGAIRFVESCSDDIIYEDTFVSNDLIGKEQVLQHLIAKAAKRPEGSKVRIDKISDGNAACGFSWTWTEGEQEGLRGTTFCELNDDGQIVYVREIPEPLYKPGDATLELLKAVTKDAQPKPPPVYKSKTPTAANELARYLFCDVQGGDIEESMRFFADDILYRDFNYDELLTGKAQVRGFIEDFSFPGIEFKPDRFDDGQLATCFTWEVCLEGIENTVKGISFYELDETTRQIKYVRDVPESAIKPPPLGNLARLLRPGLGVFQGVPLGSRPDGM